MVVAVLHLVLSDSLQSPWIAAQQASYPSPSPRVCSDSLSIESVMLSNRLIFCFPLLLPSIFPSIRDFSNESALCIRWPKYWSLSFNISSSNKYSGLIFLKIDWFDLLALQRTFRNLLQHHKLKKINSLALCLLYGPALTTVPNHWEDLSLHYMDFGQQNDVFAF